MVNVEARMKVRGKNYEILVDLDKAMQMKKGMPVSIDNVLAINEVFSDVKKALKVPSSELEGAFGTTDARVIAEKIVKNGEIQLTTEYRKKMQEGKIKQVIDFLSKHSIDPVTGRPHTPTRIEQAIKQSGVSIDNKPIEQQINKILDKLKPLIPIKIETKRLKIVIPAVHTGKVYSLLQEYKEKEDWLSNGDLSCIVNIPAGLEMEFYDKLNAITHGSSIVEEIKW